MQDELVQFYKKIFVVLLIVTFVTISVCSFISAESWIDKPFSGFLIGKARNVYPITAPGWEFYKMGLRNRDRIDKVDGIPVVDHNEFIAMVRSKKVGSVVTYQIQRGKKTLAIKGQIKRFLFNDFFFAFLIPFLLGFVFFVIGTVVFFLKSRFAPASIFAGFCCCVGTFFVTFFDAYADIRFVFFLDIALNLLPAIFIHLSLSFPVKRFFYKKNPVFIVFVYLFFLIGWQAKAYFETRNFAIWSALDLVIDVVMLASYLLFVVLLVHSVKRAPTSILRKRAQIALTGMLLAFVFPGIAIGLASVGWISFVNLPVVFTLIFPFYLGYAIVRHNLFESERILSNTLFYTVFSLFSLGFFFLLSTLFGLLFSKTTGESRNFFASFLLILIMITGFSYLKEKFQHLVDRVFFRSKLDAAALVKEIGSAFRSLFRLTEHTPEILSRFLEHLGVTRAAVFFSETISGGIIHPYYDINMCQRRINFPSSEWTIDFLEQYDRPLTPYDLEEQNLPDDIREDLSYLFQRTDGLILTPIIFEEKMCGFLIIGEKDTGEPFRLREIEVLRALTGNLGVAWENTKLLERLSEQERTEKELQIAQQIQQSFLPQKADNSINYKIAFHYQPARQVGGDLFDFFQFEEKQLGVVAGDVSGKGIPAALFGAVSSGIMKASWESRRTASSLLSGFNRHLIKIRSGKQNLSLCCALFDFERSRLQIANAGFPYVIHGKYNEMKAAMVEIGGMPLGTMENAKYKQKDVSFAIGDCFVFYSDGIIELKNQQGEFFSFERLVALVEQYINLTADQILKKILSGVRIFSVEKDLPDDQTLIVVQII